MKDILYLKIQHIFHKSVVLYEFTHSQSIHKYTGAKACFSLCSTKGALIFLEQRYLMSSVVDLSSAFVHTCFPRQNVFLIMAQFETLSLFL